MGLYDPVRDLVAADRWCGECVICGHEALKRDMICLSARTQYRNPKVLGYLCPRCFERLCDAAGVEPETYLS